MPAAAGLGPQDIAQHRTAMREALGADFVARCERELDASQIGCALAAQDLAVAGACAATRTHGTAVASGAGGRR